MAEMTLANMPLESRRQLDRVVQHHRDRDEAPINFHFAYILRHAPWAPMQADYEGALETLIARIASASTDDRRQLESRVTRFVGAGFLTGPSREAINALSDVNKLAHAWAAEYIHTVYADLDPYLDSDLPKASRVLAAYPELVQSLTPKERLLRVGHGVAPGHAWMTYKHHGIYPHPFLRRGFRSGVHYELLAHLWGQLDAGLDVSVGIDHFRLCPRQELKTFIEADAWFGAPFSLRAIDDKYAVGATVHGRSRDVSPFDKAGLLTEFRWTYADGLKALEIEELPPVQSESLGLQRPVLCRYIHTIRDISTRRFVHLDGSVTIYDPAIYPDRYRHAMDHQGSKVWATRKVKVFRVDVPSLDEKKKIAEDDWSTAIVAFFRGNELVLEYLEGRSFDEIYRARYGHNYPYWDSESVESP